MSLDNRTHSIDKYLTESQANNIWLSCVKVIVMFGAPIGAHEIYYIQNDRNELDFMET